MIIIFTKGLPGSGKSTWAKEYTKLNKNFVRVNRDDLRNMRGDYWIPKQEEFITSLEIHSIQSALSYNLNVIVDSTNLNNAHVAKLTKAAKDIVPGITVEIKEFLTKPEECIKRDLARPNSVGSEVIWNMYHKYISPTETYREDYKLPHCILVDIDGTLAENNSGRSPFDWGRVDEDDLQPHIAGIVRMYHSIGSIVIILSGRDSVCAELTTDWLKGNEVPFHKLYMRPEGNSEKDSVIKKRLFDNHIKGKYYVDFVLDDRMQVLRMWKSLGLNVLSNNPLAKEF